MDMEQMSIQDLKARLSGAVAAAESGATILITRHNEPVARLGPVQPPGEHRGVRAGTGPLLPAMAKGTGGRSLAVLLEDRGSR
jgi:prevent-host-death family protein